MKKIQAINIQEVRGFTLTEILVVCSVVGLLFAFSIPGYMRSRMQTNMLLVRDNLRAMGRNLNQFVSNDILNPSHQFPSDLTNLGTSDEEITVTATLSSIKRKDYETDGYLTSGNRSDFTFRTCPKPGKFSVAGDRCFLLNPLEVREIQPWDSSGVNIAEGSHDFNFWNGTRFLNTLFSNAGLSESSKVDILSGFFETLSLKQNLTYSTPNDQTISTSFSRPLYSTNFGIYANNQTSFDQLISKVFSHMQQNGSTLYVSQQEATATPTPDSNSDTPNTNSPEQVLSFTVRNNQILSEEALESHQATSDDAQAYNNYVTTLGAPYDPEAPTP